MKLEIKKSISNKVIMILGIMFLFLFLLGYFLLVGIDKISNVTYVEFLFSSYTVSTQFGFLLFSFVIAYFINKEYTNKNILFYKLIGDNIFTFFYKKVVVLFVECFIFIALGLVVISLIYHDFTHFSLVLLLFSAVILQYILIVGTISLLCPNILMSIGISVVYWLTSVILVSVNEELFGILAPFDASNKMYLKIDEILQSNDLTLAGTDIVYIVLYLLSIITINLIILSFMKSKWIRMGI